MRISRRRLPLPRRKPGRKLVMLKPPRMHIRVLPPPRRRLLRRLRRRSPGRGSGLEARPALPLRSRLLRSWLLLPCPGLWPEGKVHALHMAKYDPMLPRIDIFEGPWDGMAAWEAMAACGPGGANAEAAAAGCCGPSDWWKR